MSTHTDLKTLSEQHERLIRDTPQALSTLALKDRTPELCKLAVSLDAEAIAFVPEQTEELCLMAVNMSG